MKQEPGKAGKTNGGQHHGFKKLVVEQPNKFEG
jgi:hypothetical protein